MIVAATAVGLISFAQAGEPSFYKQCKDLVATPDVAKNQVHHMVRACVNYYRYGWQRGWIPQQILDSKATIEQPIEPGQGGDSVIDSSRAMDAADDYYGYKYCEELIGTPRGPRDDYTYGVLEDCVSYHRYYWRHPAYAMGSPPPEPGQPGEPGQSGQGGAGGAGGSLPGLSGGAGGDGGSLRSGSPPKYKSDGADGASYGSGVGGEGGEAGRGPGGGSGGGGGAGLTGGKGGAGGAGGSTD